MNRTQIEWVKNPDNVSPGYSWNPITGCRQGCGYCYANRLAHGRLMSRYLDNKNIAPPLITYQGSDDSFTAQNLINDALHLMEAKEQAYANPFHPRYWPNRLLDPRKLKKSAGIFCCDMGDLFAPWIPVDWKKQIIIGEINTLLYHRFYLLTKHPKGLVEFSPFRENCWVGSTVTNFDQAVRTIYAFQKIEARVKYVSFEPLLENIAEKDWHGWAELLSLTDWVIIGAQTNPYKPPEIEWVQTIVETAERVGIPVFLKNNLKPLLTFPDREWAWERYADTQFTGKIRQEMPGGV